jgi:hypothetical protein
MMDEKITSKLSMQEREEAMHSIKARQIVQEIIRYGASSDLQILKIIKFLSLELENVDMMRSICRIIDSNDEKSQSSDGSGEYERNNKIEL